MKLDTTIFIALAALTTVNAETASHCCAALADAGLADGILLPNEDTYDARIASYFSETARLRPKCIFQPRNAAEIATAVTTLVNAEPEPCKFAVRSGGHSSIPGASSIEDGVNIDLGLMNSTTYHENNQTVAIQPGAQWGSVYKTLDSLGVMVAGGRASTVGVGGLVLGGGNSFYAARGEMVCDNVVQFEVVLASGDVVLANREQNSDLFQVLKGGCSNFGIVTRNDLEAFEGSDL